MPVVRVLGPVEVEVDGGPVDLGGPALRRLLTALAVDAGRVVPDDRLADAVWGAAPPAGARRALQVYVSRLRAVLGPGIVDREGGGYRLLVGPDGLDVDVFVAAIEDGRSAAAAGDPAAAADRFAMALRAWRGEPFADLDGADRVAAVRSRLGELRASAEEELAAARIEAGDAAAAVADLTELVRAAPLRERRSTLLALALYRGGRQADALAVLRRLRAVLADELGVDPGRQAHELEQRLLAQDPALGPPPAPPAAPRRRLPPVRRPLTSFLGRAADLAELDAALAAHRLVTMVGPAGVGKTRLAVECAAGRGDVRGFARLAQVREAAELPLVLAGVVGKPVVTGDPFEAVVRTLADGPGLLVLDNCEHIVDAVAELVVDLLGECPDLRVLATSRTALHVDGERLQPVAPLPADDAMELFLDRVRAVRPGWQPGGAEEVHARRVVAALDGLPLALELGAGRAATLGLQEIADRIDDRFALLPAVPRGSVAAHASLQAAIAWSVDLLDEPDRAQLLRLWPFEGGFSLDAACAVRPDGRTVADTVTSLSTLVTWSVATADTGADRTRYLLLESIRGYCREIDPEPGATRAAHAGWVRELAARCIVELPGGQRRPVHADAGRRAAQPAGRAGARPGARPGARSARRAPVGRVLGPLPDPVHAQRRGSAARDRGAGRRPGRRPGGQGARALRVERRPLQRRRPRCDPRARGPARGGLRRRPAGRSRRVLRRELLGRCQRTHVGARRGGPRGDPARDRKRRCGPERAECCDLRRPCVGWPRCSQPRCTATSRRCSRWPGSCARTGGAGRPPGRTPVRPRRTCGSRVPRRASGPGSRSPSWRRRPRSSTPSPISRTGWRR